MSPVSGGRENVLNLSKETKVRSDVVGLDPLDPTARLISFLFGDDPLSENFFAISEVESSFREFSGSDIDVEFLAEDFFVVSFDENLEGVVVVIEFFFDFGFFREYGENEALVHDARAVGTVEVVVFVDVVPFFFVESAFFVIFEF